MKIEWLSKNAIPIRSIDPDDDDFADLMPLKSAIGDARIVALGEQTHGDGATFCAKQRLVRFLHEQMGFDVLAWESGFYDCEIRSNSAFQSNAAIQAFPGVYGVWANSGVMKPLIEYVRSTFRTNRPLRQTGFDFQFRASNLPAPLFAFIDSLDPLLASSQDRTTITELCKALDARGGRGYQPDRQKSERYRASIDRVRRSLADRVLSGSKRREALVFSMALRNLRALEERRGAIRPAYDFRDREMGETLLWLARELYPDRKIIVWIASMHAARSHASIDPLTSTRAYYKSHEAVGQIVHREIGREYYSVAFTAYQGTWGLINQDGAKIAVPTPGSFEDLTHAVGQPYTYVNLRSTPADHWLRSALIARPLGYGEQRSIWPDNFDAIFYIKEMFPSTMTGRVPDSIRTKKR